MTSAMKAGEKQRVGALRLVLSELQKAAKDGDGDELAVLRRERKRRLEAADPVPRRRPPRARRAGGGRGLADRAITCPAQLDDVELDEIVAAAIAETGANQPHATWAR